MWNDKEEEKKQATWEEYSTLHRDFLRQFTVSETDRAHKPCVFAQEQDVPRAANGNSTNNGTLTDPINFISQFTVLSHQGIFKWTPLRIDFHTSRVKCEYATDTHVQNGARNGRNNV